MLIAAHTQVWGFSRGDVGGLDCSFWTVMIHHSIVISPRPQVSFPQLLSVTGDV